MPVASTPTIRVLLFAWISLAVSGLAPTPARAEELAAEIYMADVHQSGWTFDGSRALCELSHEIPQFGVARFQRLAGEQLSFRIDSYQPVPERIEGMLREVSPPWQHAASDPLEQLIQVQEGLQPIKLDRRPAGWLLSALAKGQVGSFDMLDWNDSRKLRKIRLSPVNFQQAYKPFKQCLRELERGGFVPSGPTSVHFALDVDKLDAQAQGLLKPLADYVKADERITAVRIVGHADDQGSNRYNLKLSARRAKAVYDFLAKAGVARKIMSRRHYGESRPKVRGRSEAARAANRRAEVELVR
jgi:outer membrane protein OmpA-like peptidoglycan-associated protein